MNAYNAFFYANCHCVFNNHVFNPYHQLCTVYHPAHTELMAHRKAWEKLEHHFSHDPREKFLRQSAKYTNNYFSIK